MIKLLNFERDAKLIFESHHQGRLQRRTTKGVDKRCGEKETTESFDLAKLFDLESKFNSEALGSIAHSETG
jgi:hypothetical protein